MDDVSCLGRFNEEKSWVEFVRTRIVPIASLWKSTGIGGIIRGIHSEWAYKNLEAASDGVVDFKQDETTGEAQNLIRIRPMRNVGFDSRWHQLKVGENFEVTVEKGRYGERVLISGNDFYSSPRISPDGTRLATPKGVWITGEGLWSQASSEPLRRWAL